MGSLVGFRPPQFSEDVNWLPVWLQQHYDAPLDEQIEDELTNLEPKFKNISARKDVNLSSMDEDRYNKSFHLFLSGEDNSPASLAPSSGNAMHFHLHLSSDGTSQNMSNPLLDTSQTWRIASNNGLLEKQNEVSAGQEEMENQFRMNNNVGVMNLPSLTSQPETSNYICPQSLAKDKDINFKQNDNSGHLNVSDINEAVELSIAASEALVIHDTVKSSLSTKSSAPAAVLEVALLVKQARLEGLEDIFNCPAEDIDEFDFLSDLDESDMADAFEDVGLSVSGPDDLCACASAVSQVKDTPSSENHYICDEKHSYELHGDPKVDCDVISTKQVSRDILDIAKQEGNFFLVDVLDFDRHLKHIEDLTSGSNPSVVASHNDSGLRWSVLANSEVPDTAEEVDFNLENATSVKLQASENGSPKAWSYLNERDGKIKIVGPDRFQSRWLGGWAWEKEIDSSAHLKNNAKNIPQFMVCETSYLSESADIAPDENSFVQKQDKGSHMLSQSSIPFEGLNNKAEDCILFSQDVVGSSCLSLLDPLCSVVPCSISSGNDCSTLAQKPNDEVDSGNCSRLASEHCNLNLQIASSVNAEFVLDEHQTVSAINGEGSQYTVRRKLTSLRTYSVLKPCCNALAERDNIVSNRSFQSEHRAGLFSAEQNTGCKMGSAGLSSMKSIHKSSTARNIEENHHTAVVQNPVSDLMNQKKNYDATANIGSELQVHMVRDRCSPLILNRGRHCRFQASKEFVHDFGGEENQEQSVIPKRDVELPQSKTLQKKQFKCEVAPDADVPARKRVRFSETEIQLLQKKDLQKLQSSYKLCSTTRAAKRLRHVNPKFQPKSHCAKKRQTNCLDKAVKRLICQDLEFLLTGFSNQMEKEIDDLIRKYGGIVLADIPSPPNSRGKRSSRVKLQQLPIVLCSRKLETTKFLYGCAVNAFILKVNWLTDSVAAGSALPPDKYMIISNHVGDTCSRIGRPLCHNNHNIIFDRVGIVLHGKHSFCTKLAKVVKHGGGKVYKTLQWLVQNLDAKKISVGAIVAEDEGRALRHLKHCASDRKIPTMPSSWIVNSLYVGKLLPFMENKHSSPLPSIKILDFPDSAAWSEEI